MTLLEFQQKFRDIFGDFLKRIWGLLGVFQTIKSVLGRVRKYTGNVTGETSRVTASFVKH